MKGIIKKIQTRKLGGHVLAAGVILLGLSLGFCIVKGNWEGVLSNALWLTVACLSFKTMTRIDTLSDIIDTQERFIDRICDAIKVAKKAGNEERTKEKQKTTIMKEIDLFAGTDLDKAIEILKKEAEQASEPCFGRFNGKILYSTDTVDEAYMKVLGKTKAEFEEGQRKWKEEYDRVEREHRARIPQLTEHYRNAARGLVRKEQLEYWDEIVPIRLGDLYHGMELQQVLDCCKIMRDESLVYAARLEKAYDVFMSAGHTGMSANLTMAMLARFCPHGAELADACREFRFERSKE